MNSFLPFFLLSFFLSYLHKMHQRCQRIATAGTGATRRGRASHTSQLALGIVAVDAAVRLLAGNALTHSLCLLFLVVLFCLFFSFFSSSSFSSASLLFFHLLLLSSSSAFSYFLSFFFLSFPPISYRWQSGVAFAGVIMKLMDNCSGISAVRHCHSHVVTVAIEVRGAKKN